jgi:hypothetical protein
MASHYGRYLQSTCPSSYLCSNLKNIGSNLRIDLGRIMNILMAEGLETPISYEHLT